MQLHDCFKGDKQWRRSAGAPPQASRATLHWQGIILAHTSTMTASQSLRQLSDDCSEQKKQSQSGVLGSLGSDQIPDSRAEIQRDFNIKLQGTILSLLRVNQDFLWMFCYWVNEWNWHVSRGPLTLRWLLIYSFWTRFLYQQFAASVFLCEPLCISDVYWLCQCCPGPFLPTACGCHFSVLNTLLFLRKLTTSDLATRTMQWFAFSVNNINEYIHPSCMQHFSIDNDQMFLISYWDWMIPAILMLPYAPDGRQCKSLRLWAQ